MGFGELEFGDLGFGEMGGHTLFVVLTKLQISQKLYLRESFQCSSPVSTDRVGRFKKAGE